MGAATHLITQTLKLAAPFDENERRPGVVAGAQRVSVHLAAVRRAADAQAVALAAVAGAELAGDRLVVHLFYKELTLLGAGVARRLPLVHLHDEYLPSEDHCFPVGDCPLIPSPTWTSHHSSLWMRVCSWDSQQTFLYIGCD